MMDKPQIIYFNFGIYLSPILAAYKQQKFITVLEAGESKLKILAQSLSGESPLPGSCLLAKSSHVGISGGPLYKDTYPIYEGSILKT